MKGDELPTNIIRSKEECLFEEEITCFPSSTISDIVCTTMNTIRSGIDRREQKKIVIQPEDPMEESDSEDFDIFPDAGDYVPTGALSDKISSTPNSDRVQYFKVCMLDTNRIVQC